jgi:ElaB/YqjD/DUF883 family membrane-anchored ribosome-binding protein
MIDENGRLPEGTDTIIAGASAENDDEIAFSPIEDAVEEPAAKPAGAAGAAFASARDTLLNETQGLRSQAGDTVRAYAIQGKDRTTDALDNIVKLVSGAADTIEERLGAQYAGYARSAADTVGNVADTLREKDVDDLVEDAKTFVKNSPGIAIGAAAAVGFVLARLVKAGTPVDEPSNDKA